MPRPRAGPPTLPRDHTVTWGRSFSSVAGPIPDTPSSWSIDVNGPWSVRYWMMAAASAGPTPFNVSRVGSSALLMLTRATPPAPTPPAAAPLADGQQILVPKEGTSAGGVAAGGTGTGGAALVNINTADEPTLETLNGVGPALAAAIIQYRTDQGPFTSVDQLDEVSGIGPATLEKLRPQVTV